MTASNLPRWKKNLLVFCPNRKDATSFYRGWMPLVTLGKQLEPWMNFISASEYDWSTMAMADALFMQRPYRKEHWQMVEMAKSMGKKVWVDYDDWLLGVPTDNPAYMQYEEPDVKRNIVKIVAAADEITVSTSHLAKLIQRDIGKIADRDLPITVVSNALPLDILAHKRPEVARQRNRLVQWRGSNTHHRDVMSQAKPIIEACRANKNWHFSFLGDALWFITDMMPHENVTISKPIDPIEYFEYINKVAPSVMIVPLHDSDFNRAKSNIAYLEAAYAGAVTIAPDWEEWRHPGVLNYTDQASFAKALEHVMSGYIDVIDLAQTAWDHVRKNFDLRLKNVVRADIFGRLTGLPSEELAFEARQTVWANQEQFGLRL